MAQTYTPIATTTLSSAASSITFSSIPSTYTDLRLVLVATASAANLWLTFNSDTATNYSATWIMGSSFPSQAASSGRATSDTKINMTNGNSYGISSTIPSLYTVDIFSYAGSTNKTCLTTSADDRNGTGDVGNFVGLWRSTSAITSVTFTNGSSGTFNTGTTATLYGILKA